MAIGNGLQIEMQEDTAEAEAETCIYGWWERMGGVMISQFGCPFMEISFFLVLFFGGKKDTSA